MSDIHFFCNHFQWGDFLPAISTQRLCCSSHSFCWAAGNSHTACTTEASILNLDGSFGGDGAIPRWFHIERFAGKTLRIYEIIRNLRKRLLSCAGSGFHDTTHNDMYDVAGICANGINMATFVAIILPFLVAQVGRTVSWKQIDRSQEMLIALAYIPQDAHFPSFRSLNIMALHLAMEMIQTSS